jgi:hypothetical protein
VRRKIILYELNEVPWEIVDLYTSLHPASNISRLLASSETYTTVDSDSAGLSPWRTWPTFHKSLLAADHNSYDLGQDPDTFRGTNIWEAVDAAGQSVGLFGALQTWPVRPYKNCVFYVPDTFARDARTLPAELRAFQQFNLRMTAENSFSADAPLAMSDIVRSGLQLVRMGLTTRSVIRIIGHLRQELRDGRYKAARPMMQVLPSFDLYWRLHRRHRPSLSIFFTNHVAAMMHRYWGDGVPGYTDTYEYTVDPVYRQFVGMAMDLADYQIGTLLRYVHADGNSLLVVASSMGQKAIPYNASSEADLLVLEDARKLAAALGFPSVTMRLAMHPRCSIEFDSNDAASLGLHALASVVDHADRPLLEDLEVRGHTVTFSTRYDPVLPSDSRSIQLGSRDAQLPRRTLSYSDAGFGVRPRLGGGNTAYHVPEGILIAHTSDGRGASSRRQVDILDISPSLLANVLEIPVPESMKGRPVQGLFA